MLKIWIRWTHQTPNIKPKLFCCRWTKPRKYKCNINENNTRSRWRHQRRCREDRIVTGHPALLLWWSMMVRMSLKSVCCRVNPEMQVTLIDLFFFFFKFLRKKAVRLSLKRAALTLQRFHIQWFQLTKTSVVATLNVMIKIFFHEHLPTNSSEVNTERVKDS